jgi:hypothetical protein
MQLMKPEVYWEGMETDTKRFIDSCDSCQHARAAHSHGFLTPLAIPDDHFQSINIDFASMPTSREGFDAVLVIRDRFTKLVELVPTVSTLTALQCAELCYNHWFLLGRGLPLEIISDRDKLFTSEVWTEWCKLLQIKRAMSTSRHQQTNGGAESAVKTMKHILKRFTNYQQSNWVPLIKQAQFAMNHSTSAATGFSPFYLAHAFQPRCEDNSPEVVKHEVACLIDENNRVSGLMLSYRIKADKGSASAAGDI